MENNLAIMHVYFKNLHFMQNTRGELFGPVDFVSNIGGLLGLCMGFSALSAIEFAYYYTIRLFLNARLATRLLAAFSSLVKRYKLMIFNIYFSEYPGEKKYSKQLS